jgi:CheY-like chemotaxis protein
MTKTKAGRPRVLLVDDYPDAREMYSEYLEFSGFDVVEAANGIEALQRAVDEVPDNILMDLSLPVMDGWAFASSFARRASQMIAYFT